MGGGGGGGGGRGWGGGDEVGADDHLSMMVVFEECDQPK